MLSAAIAAAMLGASTAFSAAACAFERLAERISDAFAGFVSFVLRVAFGSSVASVRGDMLDTQASRRLTQASAFVARMVKRERPRIEQRWAMCPSV